MGQLSGNVGLVYSKENTLRNLVSFIIIDVAKTWYGQLGFFLLYLGPPTCRHIVVTYGPLKTESATNKIAKYPGLNRNHNNDNAVKERMGHEWGWDGMVNIQIYYSKGRII